MNRFIPTLIIVLFLGLSQVLQASIQAVWSTGVAVPGEQVYLYLVDEDCGDDPFGFEKEPSVKGASVKPQPYRVGTNPMSSDGKVMEVSPLLIIPDAPGELQVGTLELVYKSGRRVQVNVPALPVASTSEITWYNKPAPYGALWYKSKKDPYIDETVQASIKLFLPQQCSAPGLPSFNSVGIKVSPFNSSVSGVLALVHRELKPHATAYAAGKTWITQDFKGELTPFSEKGAEITGTIYIEQRDGIFLLGKAELPLPSLSMKPLPLPPGAPADFNKLVGHYSISTKTDASSLAMNEAVDVEIRVLGAGSFTPQNMPVPVDAEAWKLIPPTSKPILNANGERIGMTYHQLMRPVQEVSAIPAFKLSFFDPDKQQYEQAMSRPIPLRWEQSSEASSGLQYAQQANEPPPAGSIPVAEMSDIYGPLPSEVSVRYWRIPLWVYTLLYVPALILLLGIALRAWRHHRLASAGTRAQEKELARIAQSPDALSFLKAAGGFAEKNLSPTACASERIQAILKQRDEEAFRPNASSQLSKAQRRQILHELRRAISKAAVPVLLMFGSLLCIGSSSAASVSELNSQAEQAYQGGQFSEAAQNYQAALQQIQTQGEGSEDTSLAKLYYHLGNAQYRLGEEGKAALSYARALHANPQLKEAKANLSFIQRKQGAIQASPSKLDSVFTYLSHEQLKVASILASALLLLFLSIIAARAHSRALEQEGGEGSVVKAIRPQRKGIGSKLGAAIALVLCLLCGLNWIYYLNSNQVELRNTPAQQIAYVTKATVARTGAASEASALMTLPASTAVVIIAHRPSWDYIECLDGTRAWVENKDIDRLAVQP